MIRFIAALLLLIPLVAGAQAPENILPKPAAVSKKKPVAQKITEKNLDVLKLDAIGIPDTEGALGRDIWAGSKPEDITALLLRQNLSAPSAAAHKLLTRLIVSPAALDSKDDGEWLTLRLQTLYKMGEEKALKDMLAMVPSNARGEALEQLVVEQDFLKMSADKACEKVAQGVGKYKDIFWQQANIYCLAKAKKNAETELALQVWHDQKSDEKATFPFEEAIRKIMGDNAKTPIVKTFNLSPLELAIAVDAGLSFDPQIDKENSEMTPVAARFLALNSKLSLSTRTQLAERAFRIGILPREQLAELYQAASFKPEAFTKATKEKQYPASAVDARALAFQLIQKTPSLLPQLVGLFAPDLAQRLLAPDTPTNAWEKRSAAKDVRIAAVQKIFGVEVDDAAWKNAALQKDVAPGANKAALDWLKTAVASKRKGEVVLLGLWLMQYQDNSVTLASIMEAFRAMGLDKDASAMAEELFFSNGQ